MEILGEGTDSLLIFDCEFWHVFGESGYETVPKQPFFFSPRELGGIYLQKKSAGTWKQEMLYATFDNHFKNVAFPTSRFASVSTKTAKKLDNLEEELGIDWARAFPENLDSIQKKIWEKGIQVYQEDPEIFKAKKGKAWMTQFLEKYSKSRIIVKGDGDIIALRNYCRAFKIAYKEPVSIIDIAEWNEESRKKCGSAKLETSFECILPKLSSESGEFLNKINDLMGKGNPHDPRTDSVMTLGVALYLAESGF